MVKKFAEARSEPLSCSFHHEGQQMGAPAGLHHGHGERALKEFIEHFHLEPNHQGKGDVLLPTAMTTKSGRRIGRRERLGGLLQYHSRAA